MRIGWMWMQKGMEIQRVLQGVVTHLGLLLPSKIFVRLGGEMVGKIAVGSFFDKN
jgi:hypothetical protein